MLLKKPLTKVITASLLTGSILGMGTLSETVVHAASTEAATSHTTNQSAINTLHDI